MRRAPFLAGIAAGILALWPGVSAAVEYTGSSYRDPFVSAADLLESGTAEKEIGSLKLNGIMWSGTDPGAIINGKIVRAGDELPNGVQVVEIERDAVVLKFKGQEFVLDGRKKENR